MRIDILKSFYKPLTFFTTHYVSGETSYGSLHQGQIPGPGGGLREDALHSRPCFVYKIKGVLRALEPLTF